jgi:hypothetical protein
LKRSRIGEVVGALCRGEGLQQSADAHPCGFDSSFGRLAQEGLELGEDLLDRVEVWTAAVSVASVN